MKDVQQQLLGRQVSKFRKATGLTQEQLAEKISVALETISRMERGVNAPSIKTLGKIGVVLGVSIRDFFPPQTKDTEKEIMLDDLVTLLVRRKSQEIQIVMDMAILLLENLDQHFKLKPPPRRKGKLPRVSLT